MSSTYFRNGGPEQNYAERRGTTATLCRFMKYLDSRPFAHCLWIIPEEIQRGQFVCRIDRGMRVLPPRQFS